MQLRTAANKSTFQISEIVPLVVRFQSDKDRTYSIEIADHWSPVTAADRFLIEPSESVIDRGMFVTGVICCDSRRAFLRSKPTEYTHVLTDALRFTRPGEYRIQYTTRRIFTGPLERAYEPSDILVFSNVLIITIIPDDPFWADQTLPAAIAGAANPPSLRELTRLPIVGSLQPAQLSAETITYQRAARQLALLDTPAAIRAKVAAMRMPSVQQWRREEASGNSYSSMGNLSGSSRPDLCAAALRGPAAAADFGITRGYFELWAGVLLERDRPELFRLQTRDRTRDPKMFAEAARVSRQELLEGVRELNRLKSGIAAEITAATVRQVERSLGRP